MTLPDDLEDWLTNEGDRVVTQMADSDGTPISEFDRAVFEIWVLDTETRNGGVSQYFANRGLSRWHSLAQAAVTHNLPSLREFISAANIVVEGATTDLYDAVVCSDTDLDDIYKRLQTVIVAELRQVTMA